MKTIIRVVVICFVFLNTTPINICNANNKKQHTIETIKKLEALRYLAMQNIDTAGVANFLAPDVQYFHSNGMLDAKQSLLESIATKVLVHNKITTSNNTYRVYKNTVIVTGQATYDIIWKNNPMVLNFAYTNVYVKQKGKWLLVNRNTVKL